MSRFVTSLLLAGLLVNPVLAQDAKKEIQKDLVGLLLDPASPVNK